MSKYFLLIDDDEDDRLLFSLAASELEANVRCVTVQNQQEAQAALAEGQTLPDLIFLDLNMPVVSGWEYLQQFKKDDRLREVPVVIYSTSSSQRDIDRARELRALGFLVKPDDFTQLKRYLSLFAARSPGDLKDEVGKNPGGNYHLLQ
jgi:CheY-like chemotaxis protein